MLDAQNILIQMIESGDNAVPCSIPREYPDEGGGQSQHRTLQFPLPKTKEVIIVCAVIVP